MSFNRIQFPELFLVGFQIVLFCICGPPNPFLQSLMQFFIREDQIDHLHHVFIRHLHAAIALVTGKKGPSLFRLFERFQLFRQPVISSKSAIAFVPACRINMFTNCSEIQPLRETLSKPAVRNRLTGNAAQTALSQCTVIKALLARF